MSCGWPHVVLGTTHSAARTSQHKAREHVPTDNSKCRGMMNWQLLACTGFLVSFLRLVAHLPGNRVSIKPKNNCILVKLDVFTPREA
jgi:hypothetical protein